MKDAKPNWEVTIGNLGTGSAAEPSPSVKARKIVDSLLSEHREWKLSLNLDLDAHAENRSCEETRDSVVAFLKTKVSDVAKVVGDSEKKEVRSREYERLIRDLEDAPDEEEFDAVLSDLYDWADKVGVFVTAV